MIYKILIIFLICYFLSFIRLKNRQISKNYHTTHKGILRFNCVNRYKKALIFFVFCYFERVVYLEKTYALSA